MIQSWDQSSKQLPLSVWHYGPAGAGPLCRVRFSNPGNVKVTRFREDITCRRCWKLLSGSSSGHTRRNRASKRTSS
jgi:hypothetical protein